jgi:hypothetical protein
VPINTVNPSPWLSARAVIVPPGGAPSFDHVFNPLVGFVFIGMCENDLSILA